MTPYKTETSTGGDVKIISEITELPNPDITTRAVILLVCACLSQVEGAVKKLREVLQAYARGDYARLAELLPHKS